MTSGRFITFEGGEGTGKSTQVTTLAERLRNAGHNVLETREPGGTPQAEEVRALLVSGETDKWSPEAEALLNYAARDSHLRTRIRPALDLGTWVVSDRYMDSTRAYQGAAGGVDAGLLDMLQHAIVGTTVPDLTFILDLDPKTGLERALVRAAGTEDREDRFEAKDLVFHQTLRQAFLDIAATAGDRCVVVDAEQNIDDVADIVWRTVVSRLSP